MSKPEISAARSFGYRREIDGLRAIAILPVILFHAGFDTFGGGFVGVDVFFVISGYLITSLIASEQAAGTFSLIRFMKDAFGEFCPPFFLLRSYAFPSPGYGLCQAM